MHPSISFILDNMSTYFSPDFQYMFEIFRHMGQFALKTKNDLENYEDDKKMILETK